MFGRGAATAPPPPELARHDTPRSWRYDGRRISRPNQTGLLRISAVVGRRRLRGKADKQRDGLAIGEANEQGAIAIDAIVIGETPAIALHHVDVVHAPFGSKAEGRIAA